jgi:hypothetical protein
MSEWPGIVLVIHNDVSLQPALGQATLSCSGGRLVLETPLKDTY